MEILLDGRVANRWGKTIGWTRGVTDTAFRLGKVPGSESLIQLALVERVNLTWLLTGEGAPYEVLPPPHWERLPLGPQVSYYLFAGNGGLQLPLVQVNRPLGHYPTVQVYSGLPVDFGDCLEYLHRTRQPLYFAPDDPQVGELRKGWGSNRLLLGDDEKPGLLPEPDIYRDICEKLPRLSLQEHNGSYLINPQPVAMEPERDWVWALRGLDAETQRLVLELVKRLSGEGEWKKQR